MPAAGRALATVRNCAARPTRTAARSDRWTVGSPSKLALQVRDRHAAGRGLALEMSNVNLGEACGQEGLGGGELGGVELEVVVGVAFRPLPTVGGSADRAGAAKIPGQLALFILLSVPNGAALHVGGGGGGGGGGGR